SNSKRDSSPPRSAPRWCAESGYCLRLSLFADPVRRERSIVRENRALQLAQRRAGLEAELFVKHSLRVAVGIERVGLPPAARAACQSRGRPGVGDERTEAVEVELSRLDAHEVPGRLGDKPVPEHLPQPRYLVL